MSSLGTFDIGDEVKVTATFTDVNGTLTNPTALTFQVEHADATEVAYTQASPEVANPSTGIWTLTFTITVNDPGRWYVRSRATAGVKAADEDWFNVRRSVFATP
jgi:hypothetical protein